MQLDALLKSLQEHAGGFFDRICVLYRTSGKEHNKSYNLLKEKWGNIFFFKENIFQNFRRLLLKKCLPNHYSHTCFMVDDNLLFQNIDTRKKIIYDSFTDDTIAFSLRLGINCTYSHPADKHFLLKNFQSSDGFLKWNWRDQDPGDFNYPLALDGHIFKTAKIIPIIHDLSFMNPNTLEGAMQQSLDAIPAYMQSFEHSHLVGLPVNLVNEAGKNFFGKKYFYDPYDLCTKYLEGWRIDLHRMDFSGINSAHCELKLEFIHQA
jgi:hypothetical protein